MTNAFMHVASALDSKEQCPDIVTQFPHDADTWKAEFVYKRKISCGLAHWMISDNGYAKVLLADTPIKVDLIGRVINVACGRHHTLLLTENGVSFLLVFLANFICLSTADFLVYFIITLTFFKKFSPVLNYAAF